MSIYDKSSLVLIPSGTKTGKVFSQKPVSGDGDFTFTRASAATRVNADGNIEKETQNLLYQSNNFSSGFWTTSSSSVTGGQSGYDGSSDAWLLSKSGASGRLFQNLSASGVLTFSVYMKANASTWGLIQVDGSPNDAYAYVDLSNGIFGSTSSNNIIENIENVGSGWYRVSLSVNDNVTRVRVYPAETNSASGTSGSIYIQDAQIEQGLVARDYIDTTTPVYGGITDNVPRLDYTDSSCPALLLEPLRTNLFEFSEYYGTSAWSKASIGQTANDSESPEGLDNATLLYPSTSGSISYIHNSTTGSSAKYTISAFVKADGKDVVWLYISSGSQNGTIYFDLSDESIQVVAGSAGTPTGTITDMGNNWYRVTFTLGSNQSLQSGSGIGVSDAKGSTSVTKSGEDGILVYGLQIEQGTYATSYIPTYGSSVSRVKEICEVTSAEDLIGQTEGTIAGEFNYDSGELTNRLFSITGADWNTIGSIRFDIISLKPQATIRANGGEPAKIIGTQDINVGTLVKFAVVYTSTTLKMFVNGSQIGSTTTLTGSLPSTLDEIRINALGGAFVSDTQNNQLNPYKQALVFKTALTDQEAIDLTTI
jgi:hypothetical protein